VHVNFAPVADVNNNPRNPVINIRSFGEDPARVGTMVRAAIEGLQAGGVFATLKHFPGHGDTSVDTHLGLATVPHDRPRLDRVELAPFRDGIAAGAAAAMVAHVEMPALDPTPGPATFSAPIVTGLLRKQLGFDGVIYTDSMLMDAVNALVDPGEAPMSSSIRSMRARPTRRRWRRWPAAVSRAPGSRPRFAACSRTRRGSDCTYVAMSS
jgi:beta-N-acetylhexosaminidase